MSCQAKTGMKSFFFEMFTCWEISWWGDSRFNNLTIYEKAKLSIFPGTFLKDHFSWDWFSSSTKYSKKTTYQGNFVILFWIVIKSSAYKRRFNSVPFGKTKESDNVFSNVEGRSFIQRFKSQGLKIQPCRHTHLTREYIHLPRESKGIPNSGRKEIMQFHLPTDTEEKPKLTFLIKHALKELCHEIQPN